MSSGPDVMGHEEMAIRALPEQCQQKMARYVLGGWTFQRYNTAVVKFWSATKYYETVHTGKTLLTLLDTMD